MQVWAIIQNCNPVCFTWGWSGAGRPSVGSPPENSVQPRFHKTAFTEYTDVSDYLWDHTSGLCPPKRRHNVVELALREGDPRHTVGHLVEALAIQAARGTSRILLSAFPNLLTQALHFPRFHLYFCFCEIAKTRCFFFSEIEIFLRVRLRHWNFTLNQHWNFTKTNVYHTLNQRNNPHKNR